MIKNNKYHTKQPLRHPEVEETIPIKLLKIIYNYFLVLFFKIYLIFSIISVSNRF